MIEEMEVLAQKVDLVITLVEQLRGENAELRQQLESSHNRYVSLLQSSQAASQRLELLAERIPANFEFATPAPPPAAAMPEVPSLLEHASTASAAQKVGNS